VDDERRRGGGHRRPQPALLARLLPARLVHVLDRGGADRLGDLLVGRLERVAHLALQRVDAAQGDGHAEDGPDHVLEAALADVLAAGQVTDHGPQARAEGVGGDGGGDALARDVAAAGAGAGVALEFGHDGGDARQFGDLVPGRLGVAGRGPLGQGLVAALAVSRDEGDDVVDAAGRQAQAAVALVAGLTAGLASGGLLDDWGRGGRRVGRGRDGGVVAGVLPQAPLQLLDASLQVLDALEQRRDDGLALHTPRVDRFAHASILPFTPPNCVTGRRTRWAVTE
jgi:hypothetical protein